MDYMDVNTVVKIDFNSIFGAPKFRYCVWLYWLSFTFNLWRLLAFLLTLLINILSKINSFNTCDITYNINLNLHLEPKIYFWTVLYSEYREYIEGLFPWYWYKWLHQEQMTVFYAITHTRMHRTKHYMTYCCVTEELYM